MKKSQNILKMIVASITIVVSKWLRIKIKISEIINLNLLALIKSSNLILIDQFGYRKSASGDILE